jgi:hypothetical protein
MTRKSILLASATALMFSGALFGTALADDYGATPVRYDDQADQTRALNNAALEDAQAQHDDNAQPGDDFDDRTAVVPTDDRDPQDDQDDDDAPSQGNGRPQSN